MDYELNADQKEFRRTFRAFCEKEIIPRGTEVDGTGTFSTENHRRLAEIGFLGLPFPAPHGGGGKPFSTCILAWEELARACPSTFLSSGIGCLLPGVAVSLFGTEEQKRSYLRKLIIGEEIAGWALSEPQAGSDVAAIKTEARREGKAYTLNGTKAFVTNGPIADWVIVVAVSDSVAEISRKLSAFVVEKKSFGFSVGETLEKLGARGSPTSELFFNHCAALGKQVLGALGEGLSIVQKIQEFGHLASAAYSLGVAQACLEEAIRYAQKRKAFGRPIANFQEVSFKVADMQMFVDTGRLLLQKPAWMIDEGLEATTDISIAKLFLSEAATWCAGQAVQIHGGYGFLKGYKVEQLYRDAKLGEIRGGTSEMQRRRIALNLLGENFNK